MGSKKFTPEAVEALRLDIACAGAAFGRPALRERVLRRVLSQASKNRRAFNELSGLELRDLRAHFTLGCMPSDLVAAGLKLLSDRGGEVAGEETQMQQRVALIPSPNTGLGPKLPSFSDRE